MRYCASTLLLIIFISCFISSCKNKHRGGVVSSEIKLQADTLSLADAVSDFKTFRNALETVHPGLYKFTPKPEMDGIFDSLQASIKPGISIVDYYNLLRLAIARLKCSHTFIEFNDRIRTAIESKPGRYFLNLGVFYNNGHYYIQSRDTSNNYTELVSLGGHTVPELYNELRKYSNIDGGNSFIDSFELSDDFYYKYFLRYDLKKYNSSEQGKYGNAWEKISYKKDGIIKTDSVLKTTFYFAKDGLEDDAPSAFAENSSYDFTIDDDTRCAVLTINTFSFAGETMESFKYFIKSSFNRLHHKRIDKLIIDLRDNPGGSIDAMNYLASYTLNAPFKECISAKTRFKDLRKLHFNFNVFHNNYDYVDSTLMKDYDSTGENEYSLKAARIKSYAPKKNSYKGKIVVLINHATYSAASSFASLHHDRRRAVIVGEECNGDYTGLCCFYQLEVELPRSHLKFVIPVVNEKLDLRNNRYVKGRGVIPDFIIPQQIGDVINGIDTQKEFAEKLRN